MSEIVFQGSLFTTDFLTESIAKNSDWGEVSDADVLGFEETVRTFFDAFPVDQTPNEAVTESDLILKIIEYLGWGDDYLPQQNLTVKGRSDVPDGLLFPSAEAKAHANTFPQEWKRYEFGVALWEAKRWNRPLDRKSNLKLDAEDPTTPATQMLRYLRRVDDIASGKLRWGILTNGGRWRLYWQGARSISEQFFELDLAAVLGLPGHGDGLFQLDEGQRLHALRVFMLMFRREAFLPSPTDQRTFHERALQEGKVYEERVASDLSDLVFGNVFPLIVRSIAEHSPEADLQEVREAGLILLYRLLFILYAEDRNLLPITDERYDDYGLRDRVRLDVKKRKDDGDTFSTTAARYWSTLDDLCRSIDKGDGSIGLPPYNGGLFDAKRTPLLTEVRLPDSVMADVIDKLSFLQTDDGRKYINYRDLTVQQLGSIYERLLEHEVIREGELVDLRPNIFARKGSGSYYTPDDLVSLIINETLLPLVENRMSAFLEESAAQEASEQSDDRRLQRLKRVDPALRLLDLKVCDPAMGSGHFLVSLVDYLTDQVIAAMAEVETAVEWSDDYVSPLFQRIEDIRATILNNAEEGDWVVDEDQLDDRHIVRRMVLKRCVYGVDKNAMAVELAKVSLWLHSFTVGAPLSFLDHHLRCGDSLFGSWVRQGIDAATKYGSPLLLHEPVTEALGSAVRMNELERLPDAEISDAKNSARIFAGIQVSTNPLNAFLAYVHAQQWLDLRGAENRAVMQAFYDGEYGDPFKLAMAKSKPKKPGREDGSIKIKGKMSSAEKFERFEVLHAQILDLIDEERFFNWQVSFPGVWEDWDEEKLVGGFDAVIGNPPWDRMKLQQVEWFAARRPEIALAPRASDRKKLVAALEADHDPLAANFDKASVRAAAGTRVARASGEYPLLSGGDINLYSLFVERSMKLVKSDGMVGLLTPSGIASDKTASTFFKGVATQGRLKTLYDFENRRTRLDLNPFFPSVDSRFKFLVFVASPTATSKPAQCAFFLQSVTELNDPEKRFSLNADDFASVNPNTGTAPIFRTRRDAELTTAIYDRVPVLVDRSGDEIVRSWLVKYSTMFHMTNDSDKFRTLSELEENEGAYPVGGNRFRSATGDWIPLYVGRMIHQFDHRAASVEVNEKNIHNAALSGDVSGEQKADPDFVPTPQYWVAEAETDFPDGMEWTIAFRDIARATDIRTMIAAISPIAGYGNKLPVLLPEPEEINAYKSHASLLVGNLNAKVFDFVVRTKAHSTSMNWFIVEQLPVIPPDNYETFSFGPKNAAECVREIVLELTYTAHDMAPFARDMGHVDEYGEVKPPFVWNEERRLRLRAKLDAIFFHLYGITDRDDIRYIYSTFPIVEKQEMAEHNRYLSRDLCLAYMNVLAAGNPDDEPVLQ